MRLSLVSPRSRAFVPVLPCRPRPGLPPSVGWNLSFPVHSDCWFLWYFHSDRTVTVTVTVTLTAGFYGTTHSDRSELKVILQELLMFLTVSVKVP